MYTLNYLYLIIYIDIALLLAIILYILTYIFSSKNDNYYKLIDYECGFMSYTESKIIFDIQFFIVGLLFIIFDLEIIFLLP
jgi:NADH:ubiquinone oxidoreductase subunit 3 (subunit A)